LPPYQELVEHMHFGYRSGTTFYTNYGDWFAWGCLIAALFALVWSQRPNYTPVSNVRTNRAGSPAHPRP
jgi:apolipoprotein N-acyltransferase